MNIRVTTNVEDYTKELLPMRLIKASNELKCLHFSGWEDDELKAYALVSPTRGVMKDYMLNFVYSGYDPGYKNGLELLEYVEEDIKDRGHASLDAKLIGTVDNLFPMNELLVAADFVPLYLEGSLLSYTFDEIRSGKFYEIKTELEPEMKMVKGFSELIKKPYKPRDTMHSKFFVSGSEVMASMDITKIADDAFMIEDTRLRKRKYAPVMVPAMIASFINDVDKQVDGDAMLVMQLNNEVLYNGMVALFGGNKDKEHIFEYVKIF